MLHVVFGAGLIGGFLGAALAGQGFKIKFVAREPWKSRLQEEIVLTDLEENHSQILIPDPIFMSEKQADVVWLTTKCTAVESSLDELASIVHERTIIICCQNGVGAHEIIQQYLPQQTVLRAMVSFNVVFIEPNRWHRGSEGDVTLEIFPENLDQLEKALLDASQPLLQISSFHDMQALQWAKLQLNLGNSVNALANIPVKAMLEQRDYRRIIALAMEELLAVVDSMGMTLPKVAKVHGRYLPLILRTPDWIFKRVARQMLAIDEEVKTSMWWDLQHDRKTEIDYLNGAVIAEATKRNISCPVNTFLMDEVKKISRMSFNSNCYNGVSAENLLENLMEELKKDSSGK